jgi:hypothetical protein
MTTQKQQQSTSSSQTRAIYNNKPTESKQHDSVIVQPKADVPPLALQQAFERRQRYSTTTDTTTSTSTTKSKPYPITPINQPYWNLTCPLELSMFSGIHMNEDEYVHRAWASRDVAERAVAYFGIKDFHELHNRRIIFIGDSLMRQVFISIGCLLWNSVTDYTIPWFHRRQVRTQQPNTISNGPHSKFEEGRILLQGNIELIYHHGIGGLLELGEEYQTHENETWIKACYLQQPFTGLAPKYLDWESINTRSDNQDGKSPMIDPRTKVSSTNVKRERLTFGSQDVVLINASVHGTRSFNLQNIVDLFRCKQTQKVNKELWPHFYYIGTGPSHFPTKTGAFDKRLLDATENFKCIDKATFEDPQVEETTVLKDLKNDLPLVGTDILPLQMESGYLHVGGKDCLHWMQPGMPDLLAADVLRYVTARLPPYS